MSEFQPANTFISRPEAGRYLRMLAVLATPISDASGSRLPLNPPLDVWGEWQRLRGAATASYNAVDTRGAPWAVVRLAPPTEQALRDALAHRGLNYQVAHFACHGGDAGLYLEDELGRERLLPLDALTDALRGGAARSAVRLAVLNACRSETLARALVDQAGVGCVIASAVPIDDDDAKIFAERLYTRLAAGATVDRALDEAKHALRSAGRAACADGLTVYGDGSITLTIEEQAAERPRFIVDPRPHNNPPETHRSLFVGRREELLALGRWLRDTTDQVAYTISGFGGVGKTALAVQAALRHIDCFEALVFADAKNLPSFSLANVQAAFLATGVFVADQRAALDPATQIAEWLNTRATLLILDNLETVGADQTAAIVRLLERINAHNGSRALLTLRPDDQSPFIRPSRARPGAHRQLHTLDDVSAVRLVWSLLRGSWDRLAPQPSASITIPAHESLGYVRGARLAGRALVSDEQRALHHFARLARLHPGIINIAVGMTDEDGWSDTLYRLEHLHGDDLAAAYDDFIGQAVRRLQQAAPPSYAALRALTVFVGGAPDDLLRAMLDDQRVTMPLVNGLRRALIHAARRLGGILDDQRAAREFVDRSIRPATRAALLLRADERSDLEEPVRAFVAQHHLTPDERRIYELRHATLMQKIVAGYDDDPNHTYSAPREWSNVTAAIERLITRAANDPDAAQLLVAFTGHWNNTLVNGYDPRALSWLDAALHAAQRVNNTVAEANTRQAIGDVRRMRRNDYDTALADYTAALTLFQQVGSKLGEANTRKAIGDVRRMRDEYEAALADYTAALTLFQHVGDRLGEANTRKAIGDVRQFRDDYEAALADYTAALTLYQQVGDRLGEANTRRAIGDVRSMRNDYEAALADYTAALTLYQHVGNRLGEANTLAGQGQIALLQGKQTDADRLLAEAIAIYEQIGDRYSVAAKIGDYGWTLRRAGRHDEARPYLLRAADLFEAMGSEFTWQVERHRQAANSAPPPPIEEILAQWEPLLRGIVAVARGQDDERAAIEAELADAEAKGWMVRAPVQRIWDGERDAAALSQGLDEGDAAFVERVLQLLNPPPSIEEILAQWEPLLRGIVAVARGQDDERAAIEEVLPQLEANGWMVRAPVQRIWDGARDAAALTQELDAQDTAIVERVLALLAEDETDGGAEQPASA